MDVARLGRELMGGAGEAAFAVVAGGLAYVRNFYGEMGGYGKGSYRVAYREGEPCPGLRSSCRED